MRKFEDVSKEEIRDLLGKGWLTHDGMWFYTVSSEMGVDTANKLNKAAIKAMAPFEVNRLKKVTGLRENQLTGIEVLKEFLPAGMQMILPVSVFSKLHFSVMPGNTIHWEWDKGECFAYKGMSRIGVIDKYECGVMYRVVCWLELLGLKFTSTPPTTLCRMHTQGHCSGDFIFEF
ncbi:MAG: hypothetical protein JW901_01550 [Dehalococcoidia bacterium]|nr:hypothetical protein [Dehalococcoidia bacterium]